MDFWMQGFDPAVHDFGKAGDLTDLTNGEPRFAQALCGTTGLDQRHA